MYYCRIVVRVLKRTIIGVIQVFGWNNSNAEERAQACLGENTLY